jgi:hypothetical protein
MSLALLSKFDSFGNHTTDMNRQIKFYPFQAAIVGLVQMVGHHKRI